MRRLDKRMIDRVGQFDQIEAAIAGHEVAARMQTSVPELMDISSESKQTVEEMYGQRRLQEHEYLRSYLPDRPAIVERGVRSHRTDLSGGRQR